MLCFAIHLQFLFLAGSTVPSLVNLLPKTFARGFCVATRRAANAQQVTATRTESLEHELTADTCSAQAAQRQFGNLPFPTEVFLARRSDSETVRPTRARRGAAAWLVSH